MSSPLSRVTSGSFALLVIVTAGVSAVPAVASGDGVPLDRARVIALAAARAPDVVRAARARAQSRAAVTGVRVFAEDNPTLRVGAGPRYGETWSADAQVGVQVPLPLGFERARAIDAAEAWALVADEELLDEQRRAVGLALAAYAAVLYEQRRISLAQDRHSLALRLVEVARSREAAGDASRLEVELGAAELAAARSAVLTAEKDLIEATAVLAQRLSLPSLDLVDVTGSLEDQLELPLLRALVVDDELIARTVARRPDAAAARASEAAAQADVRRGAVGWIPNLSVGASYEYEEQDHVGFLSLGVELPLFEHGQGRRALAAAELESRRELAGVREALVRVDVQRAARVYDKAAAAAAVLAEEGVPRALRVEEMAAASYAAGKLDLPSLLVVRRDVLSLRAQHLDRQLDAALAANHLLLALADEQLLPLERSAP